MPGCELEISVTSSEREKVEAVLASAPPLAAAARATTACGRSGQVVGGEGAGASPSLSLSGSPNPSPREPRAGADPGDGMDTILPPPRVGLSFFSFFLFFLSFLSFFTSLAYTLLSAHSSSVGVGVRVEFF